LALGMSLLESGRVALIRYTVGQARYVGSGLLLDDRRVLTANHTVDGTVRRVEGRNWSRRVVTILRSGSLDIDLALLTLDEPVVGFTRLNCAQVDHERVDRVDSCIAVGFPRWKKRGDVRTSAQVEGWIPTAEGQQPISGSAIDEELLTLVGNRIPSSPGIPSGHDVLADTTLTSVWGGMSGAVVVADLLIVGVVRSHNLAEGGQSLTVTPITAISALPSQLRDQFWQALGVQDSSALPTLPRKSNVRMPKAERRAFGEGVETSEQPLPRTRPVGDWNPLQLGVHRAIASVSGGSDDRRLSVLPAYVIRDHDRRLRRELDAAQTSSLVAMLVGGSSTGKTRSAYEGIIDRLKDWQLVQPVTAADLVHLVDRSAIAPHTVVWLNETQTYLDGSDGEAAAAAVRRLVANVAQVLVVGTVWPNHWHAFTRPPQSTRDQQAQAPQPQSGRDQHPQARQLLEAAVRIDVPEEFRADELEAAMEQAKRDPRLAVALAALDGGGRVTQVLAAGPDLVDRWQNAPVYSGAVITAAVDACRLGHNGILSPGLLRHAAVAYLTGSQRATAPADWFDAAVVYSTEEVKGAIAPLTPTGHAMGQIDGYQLADYLLQHGRQVRRTELVPDVLWQTLVAYTRDGDALDRLADAAYRRGRYGVAQDLWRLALAEGNMDGAWTLAELLEGVGRAADAADVLMHAVAAGRGGVFFYATDLLTRLGRADDVVKVVRQATESGDSVAAWWTADRLAKAGRNDAGEDVLRHAIAVGNADACLPLARLLRDDGQVGAVVKVLREAYAAGELAAVSDLSDLLALGQGAAAETIVPGPFGFESIGVAVAIAAASIAKGGLYQPERTIDAQDVEALRGLARTLEQVPPTKGGRDGWLARLVADVSPTSSSLQTVLQDAAAGELAARHILARLLVRASWVDDAERVLGPAVAAGDPQAARRLGEVRSDAGNVDEAEQAFRQAVAGGDREAVHLLGRLLWNANRRDEAEQVLRRAAAGGDAEAAQVLARLVEDEQEGRGREALDAMRLAFAAGDDSQGSNLIEALAASGQIEEAVETLLKEGGDGWTTWWVVKQLTGPNRTEVSERALRRAFAAGDTAAGRWLAGLLNATGRTAEAEQVLRQAMAAGSLLAGNELAEHLEKAGRDADAEQVLRQVAGGGDDEALLRLTTRLEATGRSAEAERLLRKAIIAGADPPSAIRLGVPSAVERLTELLKHEGRAEEAAALRRYGLTADGSTATSW
jgi:tetratricopeptide (TPR) repeat protein